MTDMDEGEARTERAEAGNPLKGVALVVLAVLAFALSDTAMKVLAERHPVPVVIAVRYAVNLLVLFLVFAPRFGASLWATRRTGLVILRALMLAAGSLTMGLALKRMPVGETVAIIYLAPFAVLVLSGPLLGEKVRPAGWLAAMLGFSGVLLILRPGGGLDPVGVIYALVNAAFGTAYHLMTRQLTRTETTQAMLFHVALTGTIVFAVMAFPDLPDALSNGPDFALMCLIGLMATAGHFMFTAAYREAPAGLIAPVNYLHLVWAGLLGFIVFGHVPDALAIAGMALVVSAGGLMALVARKG